jgi:hypothetical protein
LAHCDKIHEEYDRYANAHVQVGQLPAWMHVDGKVAWYVFQGPYRKLPEGWGEFMKKAQASNPGGFAGPPGDVYACDPQDHKGNEQRLITILWAPLKP